MKARLFVSVVCVSWALAGCPQSENPPDAFSPTMLDAGGDLLDAPVEPVEDSGLDASAPADAPGAEDVFRPVEDTGGPDARTACPMEGARRRLPCDCGASREETCTGGVWVESEACGVECIPGTRRDTPSEEEFNCSESHRDCGMDCRWGALVYTVLPGECNPEDLDNCGFPPLYNCRCTASCTCVDVPDCTFTRP
jgi:hypothetical protein